MSAKKADRWKTVVAERRVGHYELEVRRATWNYKKPWRWVFYRKGVVVRLGYAKQEWQAKLYARRAMEKHARGGR